MPRPINEEEREHTIQQIKSTARQLMRERGTAGIAMRPIAKRMGITAPALYHYFANQDDLITALLVENFNNLANHMAHARDTCTSPSHLICLLHVLEAFRDWSLTNPVDFDLISGNPIPGYHAPESITAPAAARTLEVPIAIIVAGMAAGEIVYSLDMATLEPELHQALETMRTERGLYDVPLEALYLAVVGWTQAFGIISLEVHNQLQPVIFDTAAFFRHQMRVLINQIASNGQDHNFNN